MGVPTSEVSYTPAMPRTEDHEVHKDMWWHWGGKKYIVDTDVYLNNVHKTHSYLLIATMVAQMRRYVMFYVYCISC